MKIFAPGAALDAARHVDRMGTHCANSVADVRGIQTASQD